MQKKLQQLSSFFHANKFFALSLLWLFSLPIYSGEIIASSHALIFGKYINYLHIRISLHLLLSIVILVAYLRTRAIRINKAHITLTALTVLFPLLSVQLLSIQQKFMIYLSAYFHLVEFTLSLLAGYLATKEILANSKRFAAHIFTVINLSLVLQILFGGAQYFSNGPFLPKLLSWTGQPLEFTSNSFIGIWEYSRVYGTTPHPNILAAILVFYIFIVLSLKLPEIQKLIHFGVTTILLLTTFSKAGILALTALLFVYLTRNKIRVSEKLFVPLLLLANLFLVTFFHYLPILDITATFIESRFTIHQLYLELLQLHPQLWLTGTGFTLSIPTLLANATSLKTSIIWGNQILAEPPHNIVVLLGIELGIPITLGLLYWLHRKLPELLFGLENWQKFALLALTIILGGVDHYLIY